MSLGIFLIYQNIFKNPTDNQKKIGGYWSGYHWVKRNKKEFSEIL